MPKLEHITNLAELQRLLEEQEVGESRHIDAKEMAAILSDRVKGQDHVIQDLSRLVQQQWAKEKRKRPIANLLFLGPTGTGKTELAKTMAEYLYKEEKNMLMFFGSELQEPHSKYRLIGQVTGYVGAEKGGQLTRPLLNNPKRLIVFDEIEKAHPQIMDLFLQLMGDGQIAEQGSGEVADATQSIIILTSNYEEKAISKLQEEISDPEELLNAVKSHLSSTGGFRPEIMGRIDKVYIFKPLKGIVIAEIVGNKIAASAKEYGLELGYVDARLILEAMKRGNKLAKFGMREMPRQIDAMFADHFIAAKKAGGKKVRLELDEDGLISISPAD